MTKKMLSKNLREGTNFGEPWRLKKHLQGHILVLQTLYFMLIKICTKFTFLFLAKYTVYESENPSALY